MVPDYERGAELLTTYADLNGSSSTHCARGHGALGEPKLATLDHRHFGTMRPRHVEALELLPAGS